MNILVTGGAGYIGSHVVLALEGAGHRVSVIDDLSTGVQANVSSGARFHLGDIGDAALLARVFAEDGIEAVMHFAASSVVPESVEKPLLYYRNNTVASRILIEACVVAGVERFVFSSTASVYGALGEEPARESMPLVPINPYGSSKLMTEWMLRDVAAVHPLRYIAFRYFNVAGADPAGRTGESVPHATHLIKIACQAALGKRPFMSIFGEDYPTPDGTCVRDYIHVSDLADAHLLALQALDDGGPSEALNCGYGHGYSVREVVDAVKKVSGVDFEVRRGPRRAGDPPNLISDPSRLFARTGWSPKLDDLEKIVASALAWERGL